MDKFWRAFLKINLIAAPFVFGWAAWEYSQAQRSERELRRAFAETEAMLNDVNKKWIN